MHGVPRNRGVGGAPGSRGQAGGVGHRGQLTLRGGLEDVEDLERLALRGLRCPARASGRRVQQLRQQAVGGPDTLLGVRVQQPRHPGAQRGRVLEELELRHVLGAQRVRAEVHLGQDHAHRGHTRGVEVHAPRGVARRVGLRGQVPGGSHHRAGVGQARVVETDRDAEVREPGDRESRTRGFEQHVGGFHIAVHPSAGVHEPQGLQQLAHELLRQPVRHRAVVLQRGLQGAAGDKFHGDRHVLVLRRPAVGRDHVRVVQVHGLLAHEAQQVRGVPLPQQLGRALRAQPQVVGAPHGTAAALRNGRQQLETAGDRVPHCRAALIPASRGGRCPCAGPGPRS